jgi:hypothetical protein
MTVTRRSESSRRVCIESRLSPSARSHRRHRPPPSFRRRLVRLANMRSCGLPPRSRSIRSSRTAPPHRIRDPNDRHRLVLDSPSHARRVPPSGSTQRTPTTSWQPSASARDTRISTPTPQHMTSERIASHRSHRLTSRDLCSESTRLASRVVLGGIETHLLQAKRHQRVRTMRTTKKKST